MNDDLILSATSSEVGTKTLLIIRHAKSSWDISTLNDFDRPLNERGKKDAPMMANRLLSKKIPIDAFVSSPAKRAKKTAEIFCEEYGKSDDALIYLSMLYNAPFEVFYEALANLDDAYKTIALFSHNPGITDFVNTLTDGVRIDNMPTCGVFAVKVSINKWADIKKGKKDFLFFDYPKLT